MICRPEARWGIRYNKDGDYFAWAWADTGKYVVDSTDEYHYFDVPKCVDLRGEIVSCDTWHLMPYRLDDTVQCANELAKIGVMMCDSNDKFRPFNEVLKDLAKALKEIRETSSNKRYEIVKNYMFVVLLGERLKFEMW